MAVSFHFDTYSIPIIFQGISVRRLHLSYLAIYRQIAETLPLATPCNFCFPECRKVHLNLNPLDSNLWSLHRFKPPFHYTSPHQHTLP